jgi:O-succinylbenzoate synthase
VIRSPLEITMGLTNLAQMCNSLTADEWPQLIHDHFEN